MVVIPFPLCGAIQLDWRTGFVEDASFRTEANRRSILGCACAFASFEFSIRYTPLWIQSWSVGKQSAAGGLQNPSKTISLQSDYLQSECGSNHIRQLLLFEEVNSTRLTRGMGTTQTGRASCVSLCRWEYVAEHADR